MAAFKQRTCAMGAMCAIGALSLGVSACGDPDLKTDLDTEGAPEVLAVTVTSEADGTLVESLDAVVPDTPTFCADSGKVNYIICPEPDAERAVMDAIPMGWSIRIVFSELLDADLAEELIDTDGDGEVDSGSLANTQPVTLTCGGTAVAYDGFYDPSGNQFSFPPGPSLVVTTTEFVATGTDDCELQLGADNLKDKDGESVPDGDRGPYTFGIATLKVAGNDPMDMATGADPTMTVPTLVFNAPVDTATIDDTEITLNDGTGNVSFTATPGEMDPTLLQLVPDSPLAENTTYTVTVAGDAEIDDIEGGALEITEDFSFTFMTGTAPSGT